MGTGRIYTIGHSTRTIESFVGLLRVHGVLQVLDVRTIPRSRTNPQFNEDELRLSLPRHDIGYERLAALGGLRHPSKDSINRAWRNASFRGYADYMQTDEFRDGIAELVGWAVTPVAVMCAEAVPWRCHRSLIGDALLVRGIEVYHIVSDSPAKRHELTRFAQVDGLRITYPPRADPPSEPGTSPAG